MIAPSQRVALEGVDCEIAFDSLTRQLYATDASMYQIEPAAVAFPRGGQQTSALVKTAFEHGITLAPRGAGTGLAGGALSHGLILDFARHNRAISELNLEKRTVRVESGVVLDQLNAFLKPRGFCFGPDVATSSRATFGGMIANNSSGSNVPVYGCVADHVVAVEAVCPDGRIETFSPNMTGLPEHRRAVAELVADAAEEIRLRMPPGLPKRWPGYALDRLLREPSEFHQVLSGSEGTLAAILSAEVRIVPLPKRKTVGLIFFDSVAEALQATVALMDLKPAAIEHLDRFLFDPTRGQLAFKDARALLELDAKPTEAILLVEFYDDNDGRLQALKERKLGTRTLTLDDPAKIALVWNLRKAGLSLLSGVKGSAKPVTLIEDTGVRPEQLPEYAAGLRRILDRRGLRACFYGHAAAGLLHVRPVLDVSQPGDLKKFREVADETAALVKEFHGTLAGEHGVGMARVEYMTGQLGEPLVNAMRDIKRLFDPKGLFNPGKVIPDGRYKVDTYLRTPVPNGGLPFEPMLAFSRRDESFLANLSQCNGCGGCRKETPAMCPTFIATGDEAMSTRGRANAIRAALNGASGTDNPLQWEGLASTLASCLSCKACVVECPSNVNLPLLKAELVHARHKAETMPLSARAFSAVDQLGRAGTIFPSLSNGILTWNPARKAMQQLLGISTRRPLPPFAKERFDRWFEKRQPKGGSRGRVWLWDDTFARYHEPNVGQAAVALLEAAGFEVALVHGRKCCGRPAFSQGNLDEAARLGKHNIALILEQQCDPILFTEPSCYAMFADDYIELKLPGAEEARKRCVLAEKFLDDLLTREPKAIRFNRAPRRVVIHAHCHTKALMNPGFMKRLLERAPGIEAVLLNSGCCGMAGAFGMMESNYELSKQVFEPLKKQLDAQPPGTTVVASGTSCRHQIADLARLPPRHLLEVLAESIAPQSA
jgi:FAD/FMN-containing dehydrogenase/Fe-S oxidoreductase